MQNVAIRELSLKREPKEHELIHYLRKIPQDILTKTQLREFQIGIINTFPQSYQRILDSLYYDFPEFTGYRNDEEMDYNHRNTMKYYFEYFSIPGITRILQQIFYDDPEYQIML